MKWARPDAEITIFQMPNSSRVTLEYSSAPPRYVRWRGLLILCALSFVLGVSSCFFVLPIYRQYEVARQRAIMVTVRRSEIVKRFEEQLLDAGEECAKGKVNDVLASLEAAEVARDADSALFSEAELEEMTQRISRVRARVDAIAATQPREAPATRSSEVRDGRTRTISTLISRCGDQIRVGHYRQAAGICVQIQELDPENEFGRAMFPLLKELTDEVKSLEVKK